MLSQIGGSGWRAPQRGAIDFIRRGTVQLPGRASLLSARRIARSAAIGLAEAIAVVEIRGTNYLSKRAERASSA